MIALNGSFFPLDLAVLWEAQTVADIDAMRVHFTTLHARQLRFAVLVDARRAAIPPATTRRALADMTNGMAVASNKYSVGVAIILDSPILVGALTALRWFMKVDVDTKPFSTCTAGYAWLTEKLALEKLAPGPGCADVIKRLETAPTDSLASFGA